MENNTGENTPEIMETSENIMVAPDDEGFDFYVGDIELSPLRLSIQDSNEVEVVGDDPARAEMFEALAKYFEEVVNPENVADNSFFKSKYAPLAEVLNTVRPIMGKHGLFITQAPKVLESGDVSVQTIITHKSGAYMSFPSLKGKPAKPDIQGIGSVITYLRRFAINSITGVSGEVDDDGNTASGNVKKTTTKSKATNTENPLKKELIAECTKYVANDSKKRAEVTKALKAVVPTGNVNNITKDADFKKAIDIVKGLS